MGKTYIARSDAEAAALHAGTQTVIVIPLDPPIPLYPEDGDGYSFRSDLAGGLRDCRTFKSRKYRRSGLHNVPCKPCPYSPGDQIAVRVSQEVMPMGRMMQWVDVCTLACRSVACKVEDGVWKWFVEVEHAKRP